MNYLHKIKAADKIPVTLTEKFTEQYQYLCRKSPNKEWSGVLFYSAIGVFPKTVIVLESIFPMDVGSSASTSYVLDEDVVDYRMNNPETDDQRIGHIHSHCNMDVFFSGTDKSELEDNAPNHVYYLSVVVNNNANIIGQIYTVSEIKTDNKIYLKQDDGYSTHCIDIETDRQYCLVVYDCEIKELNIQENVDENFIKRVKTIIDKSKMQYTHSSNVNNIYHKGRYISGINPFDKQDRHNNHHFPNIFMEDDNLFSQEEVVKTKKEEYDDFKNFIVKDEVEESMSVVEHFIYEILDLADVEMFLCCMINKILGIGTLDTVGDIENAFDIYIKNTLKNKKGKELQDIAYKIDKEFLFLYQDFWSYIGITNYKMSASDITDIIKDEEVITNILTFMMDVIEESIEQFDIDINKKTHLYIEFLELLLELITKKRDFYENRICKQI